MAVENIPDAETYLISNRETCPYFVSYIIFSDNKINKPIYDEIINDVTKNNENVTETTNISFYNNRVANYKEYSTDGEYYKIYTLNKNTLLYASANKTNKEQVLELLDNLFYSCVKF